MLAAVASERDRAEREALMLVGATEREVAAASRLAAIVESSADAIIGKTLTGTITSWNTGAEDMYGHTAHEMVDRNISLIVPPDRAGEASDILERVGRGQQVEPYETERVHRDGQLIDVSIAVSPLRDRAGAIVGASTVARDISEQKRALRSQTLLRDDGCRVGFWPPSRSSTWLQDDAIVGVAQRSAIEAGSGRHGRRSRLVVAVGVGRDGVVDIPGETGSHGVEDGGEPLVGDVHRGQAAVHVIAAVVEPVADVPPCSLGLIHGYTGVIGGSPRRERVV